MARLGVRERARQPVQGGLIRNSAPSPVWGIGIVLDQAAIVLQAGARTPFPKRNKAP